MVTCERCGKTHHIFDVVTLAEYVCKPGKRAMYMRAPKMVICIDCRKKIEKFLESNAEE